MASSLVVGIGAIQEVIAPQNRTPPEYLEYAIYFSLVAQVLICFVAWRAYPARRSITRPTLTTTQARVLLLVSSLALCGLTAFEVIEKSREQVLEASAFSVVVLIAIGALTMPRSLPRPLQSLVVIASVGVYAQVFQGGTGRLRLVALACTIALIWSATHTSKHFKALLLALTPVGLALLAFQRLSLQESIRAGASVGRTGLESMTEPILVFAQVIQAQVEGRLQLADGQTLITLPISLLREHSGVGGLSEPIGYRLVQITDPARYGSGYSVAATTFGEWWYNFSWVAIFLVAPFLAILLTLLDREFLRLGNRLSHGPERFFWFAFVAMACGSIADLAWMGLHIYGARMLWRLPALLLICVCIAPYWRPRSSTAPPPVDDVAVNALEYNQRT